MKNKKGLEMAGNTMVVLVILLILLVVTFFFISRFILGPTNTLSNPCNGETEYSTLEECNTACNVFCRTAELKESKDSSAVKTVYCCVGGKKS